MVAIPEPPNVLEVEILNEDKGTIKTEWIDSRTERIRLSHFTEEELRIIGSYWTEQLIQKGKE